MLYTYKCDCGNVFDDIKSVAERETSECPKCGKVAHKTFVPGTGPVPIIFQPYLDPHISNKPVFIETRAQKKALLKHHGLEQL